MSTPTSPQPAKRSSWLRKLLYVVCALIVLLVLAFFVVTSGAFFKGTILPRVSAAVGAPVTVADASISPFSQVVLTQLKVAGSGGQPILQAAEVRLRYSLMSILGGNIKVDELTVESPAVDVVENADGTRNTDVLLKGNKTASPASTSTSTSSKTPHLDVKNLALKNATVRYVKHLSGGGTQSAELSKLTLRSTNWQTGRAAN